jgi:hypothetical protein
VNWKCILFNVKHLIQKYLIFVLYGLVGNDAGYVFSGIRCIVNFIRSSLVCLVK